MIKVKIVNELHWLDFSVEQLLQEIHKKHFKNFPLPSLWFAQANCLARIVQYKNRRPEIALHHYLNHPETPREVIELILIHEMLHLQISSREIEGKLIIHPPEFKEMEHELYPNSREPWKWIGVNTMFAVDRKASKKHQGMILKPKVMKEIHFQKRYSYAEIAEEFPDDDLKSESC